MGDYNFPFTTFYCAKLFANFNPRKGMENREKTDKVEEPPSKRSKLDLVNFEEGAEGSQKEVEENKEEVKENKEEVNETKEEANNSKEDVKRSSEEVEEPSKDLKSKDSTEKMKVQFKSDNGEVFLCPVELARKSKTIHDMLDHSVGWEEEAIPLPYRAEVVKAIIAWLEFHDGEFQEEEFKEKDRQFFQEHAEMYKSLVQAAGYLDIPSLCSAVTTLFKEHLIKTHHLNQ